MSRRQKSAQVCPILSRLPFLNQIWLPASGRVQSAFWITGVCSLTSSHTWWRVRPKHSAPKYDKNFRASTGHFQGKLCNPCSALYSSTTSLQHCTGHNQVPQCQSTPAVDKHLWKVTGVWDSQSQALLTFWSCSVSLPSCPAHTSPLSWRTCSKVSSGLGLSLLVTPVPRGEACSSASEPVMQKTTSLARVDCLNQAESS